MNKPPPNLPKSTITDPPTVGALIAADPVVALWVPALGYDVPLLDLATFTIGREGADVLVPHASMSRQHCQVRRTRDGFEVRDLDSKNGTWVEGARITSATLTPMKMIKLGQVPTWPLTAPLLAARHRLAYYLGHAPEPAALVVDALADAVAGRSFVVVGDPSREPTELANALIAASPRRAARRRDITLDKPPVGDEAIRDLASGMRGGVVTVDLDVLARAGERACEVWQTTLGKPLWDLLVVWHGSLRMPPWPGMPRTLTIPTVAARAKANELGRMVGHLIKMAGAGWSIDELGRTGLRAAALHAYGWDGNHAELRQMVTYAVAMMGDQKHAAVARAMGIDRGKLARMVERWGGR